MTGHYPPHATGLQIDNDGNGFSEVFRNPLGTEREQYRKCDAVKAKEKETLVLVKAKQQVREAGGPFEQARHLENMENSDDGSETLMDLPTCTWSGRCTEVSSSPTLNMTLHCGSKNIPCLSWISKFLLFLF